MPLHGGLRVRFPDNSVRGVRLQNGALRIGDAGTCSCCGSPSFDCDSDPSCMDAIEMSHEFRINHCLDLNATTNCPSVLVVTINGEERVFDLCGCHRGEAVCNCCRRFTIASTGDCVSDGVQDVYNWIDCCYDGFGAVRAMSPDGQARTEQSPQAICDESTRRLCADFTAGNSSIGCPATAGCKPFPEPVPDCHPQAGQVPPC